MRWRQVVCLGGLVRAVIGSPSFSSERKREMRELIRATWYHGCKRLTRDTKLLLAHDLVTVNSYMRVAFPMDELRPISCQGMGPDKADFGNFAVNDVNGNFSLTLVDVLDTFVVLGDKPSFEAAVRAVIASVQFDVDSRVQVFEATIRVLGGLLSAHLFATEPKFGFALSWYNDELLTMARDLANRMLPAFSASPTGIPFARVNLRHGLLQHESAESCAAAAGSLLLEFATLSRLTGDPLFEDVARTAFYAVWNRRSHLDLVGNSIDVRTGSWMYPVASIGAGVDSLYEYMLKSYVMLGEEDYLDVWNLAYKAVQKHLRSAEGLWYRSVNMVSGITVNQIVDSLSAFMPGLQVLSGDIESAIRSHQLYTNEWIRYRGIPEAFAVPQRQATSLAYPLRPELVESTLFLYQATNDDAYLKFGERMVYDIINRTRIDCGLASVLNLETGALEDRMHSFALSETLKYAYLIFDEHNQFNHDIANTVFTTEGHLIPLPKRYLRPPSAEQAPKIEQPTCPVYTPNSSKHWSPLALSVMKRTDSDYARLLAGVNFNTTTAIAKGYYDVNGFCEKPLHEEHLVDLFFANPGSAEDIRPSSAKVAVSATQIVIRSIENLRMQLARRSDPSVGIAQAYYDISKIAHLTVAPSHTVVIADPSMRRAMLKDMEGNSIDLHFKHDTGGFDAQGQLSSFGPSVFAPTTEFAPGKAPVDIVRAPSTHGCEPYSLEDNESSRKVVTLVRRGECTFAQKSSISASAGAKGVLVINSDDSTFTPSSDSDGNATEESHKPYVPLIMLTNSTGVALEQQLAISRVTITTKEKPKIAPEAIESMALVLNGFVIRNARLSST